MLDQLPLAPAPVRTRTPATRAARHLRATSVELAGVAGTVALALGILSHLVLSQRATVFFYSGDSVLMPLVERSLREGQPFEWAMSSVLFFVPEIPVYVAIATVVPGVHAALLVNAGVTVVGLYGILRGLAAVVVPWFSRRTKVALALAPVAALTLCSLMEHTGQRATLELVSLFLTTTYYYGTTLAMVGALPLVVVAANGRTGRARRGALVGLVSLAAAATFSNPLFAMWAAVPVAIAALLLWRRRLLTRRPAVAMGAALLVGSLVGYVARIPMAKYISIQIGHYLRIDRMALSVRYYVNDYFFTASTWQGAIEMSLLAVAVTGTLAVAVIALARHWPTRITLPLVVAACSIVVTVVAAVGLGTTASRYLMPLFFMPAAAAVVLGGYALERAPGLTGLSIRWPSRRILVRATAIAVVAVTACSIGAVRLMATAPATQTYASATCLSNWIGGRDLTGAGRFWTMRALTAYGDQSVTILQITADYNATLWLDNAADYTGQDVSYLVLDAKSHYSRSPQAVLGDPAQTITCGQYTILDYLGTTGESILTGKIARSAAAKIAERHL
ncbi:hypothetical protein AX769_19605 [Frondihabitans sp. PAMC 28766]|uniref:hypothetical protein n=1 Tax=Frondihabitans sp. PAMC 28766 TaxID=1795630 RepID=UPI00078C2FB2|nr:hypothetical protein [Frondihabitans sp. PAMC 28766]AMM21945.1 hypothetical protein AX769_19605 [Frondihabitans sp. PAMC 28766]